MKRLYLPLILFFLLIFEGVALELLPDKLVSSELMLTPHWVLVFLVFLAVFYDRDRAHLVVLFALIFGLLIDIVYTGILGVYMFSYAVSIYIIHGLTKLLHSNIFSTIVLGMIGVALTDIFINVIYSVVGIANLTWDDYIVYRLLPTILANLLFLIIVYPIIVKQLVKWRNEQSNSSLL